MSKVIVETSYVHLISPKNTSILFGEGTSSQRRRIFPARSVWVCEERVTVVGPKKSIPGVSILGPARSYSG